MKIKIFPGQLKNLVYYKFKNRRHAFQFKINFKGGIVSPGYLRDMLDGLQQAGVKQVRFGLRQQLLVDAAKKDHKKIKISFIAGNVDYEVNKDFYPNISSSYPAAEIFIKDTWLSEEVYKDIFDQFEYKAQLKINIADCNRQPILTIPQLMVTSFIQKELLKIPLFRNP